MGEIKIRFIFIFYCFPFRIASIFVSKPEFDCFLEQLNDPQSMNTEACGNMEAASLHHDNGMICWYIWLTKYLLEIILDDAQSSY
jgi:hypothetical protein